MSKNGDEDEGDNVRTFSPQTQDSRGTFERIEEDCDATIFGLAHVRNCFDTYKSHASGREWLIETWIWADEAMKRKGKDITEVEHSITERRRREVRCQGEARSHVHDKRDGDIDCNINEFLGWS